MGSQMLDIVDLDLREAAVEEVVSSLKRSSQGKRMVVCSIRRTGNVSSLAGFSTVCAEGDSGRAAWEIK
ncbi:hypothetical protein ACJ73_06072 [Blastomyces percursus]|uniref:Uncharacterized protein n=1 Tax=Blastomyces percursus TaxID=1658174 RepID=A0A1J9R4M7_9EURO|nr:hypothetical protein ACJ73_06072 [Blastomyces percursus]